MWPQVEVEEIKANEILMLVKEPSSGLLPEISGRSYNLAVFSNEDLYFKQGFEKT